MVKQYIYSQIKSEESEFWSWVNNDVDVIEMTDDDYDCLVENILALKVTVH